MTQRTDLIRQIRAELWWDAELERFDPCKEWDGGTIERVAALMIEHSVGPEGAILPDPAAQEKIDAARDRILNEFRAADEIEVDDDADSSRGDDPGCWVSAWIWVPDREDE